MTSSVATERAFTLFRRGEVREDALRTWANRLRRLTNPDTGALFTEDEIAAAVVRQSRWWIEADKDDLMMLAAQQRGLFLANQFRPDRASTGFLHNHHGALWLPDGPLPAVGGSGFVSAPATVGSPFLGSTTLPSASATWLRDTAGRRYQVLFPVAATAAGAGGGIDGAVLLVKGIDTGTETNIAAGTELEYAQNAPLGSTANPTVTADFRDGAAAELDSDFAKRIMSTMRHKAASGNAAHFRFWARGASVSVEDAFVYPCAFHANSLLVAITAKRGLTRGPLGRIPSVGTLADVIARIVPPGSPVVPAMPHVLVVDSAGQAADLVIVLDMRRASSSGWTDPTPWPGRSGVTPTAITNLTNQTHWRVTVPGAVGAPATSTPALMALNPATTRLEKLSVTSVASAGGSNYDVVLSAPPSFTIALGHYISPDNGKRSIIDAAVEAYFDSLGPGEVVAADDDRAHRAARFPEPFEEFLQVAGSGVGGYLRDALQASLANDNVSYISSTTPTVPTDPGAGPALMVAGQLAVYPE